MFDKGNKIKKSNGGGGGESVKRDQTNDGNIKKELLQNSASAEGKKPALH